MTFLCSSKFPLLSAHRKRKNQRQQHSLHHALSKSSSNTTAARRRQHEFPRSPGKTGKRKLTCHSTSPKSWRETGDTTTKNHTNHSSAIWQPDSATKVVEGSTPLPTSCSCHRSGVHPQEVSRRHLQAQQQVHPLRHRLEGGGNDRSRSQATSSHHSTPARHPEVMDSSYTPPS